MRDDPAQEIDVGLQPADRKFVEHAQQTQARLLAIFTPGNQLAEHRIVERRNLVTFLNAAVYPPPRSLCRFAVQIQTPGGRQEIVRRIFGIQTHFDRVTIERYLRLGDRQHFPTGDANLPGDQIQSGDCFGYRVLDLQPRVHLHEEKLAARIQQKLHGAGADITDRLRRTHSRFAHCPAQLGRQTRRRGFFDDFLVPTLDRAVALVEVQAVAVLIGEHLNLHMTRLEQILFHQHPRVAKRRLRFALRRGEGFSELADILDDFHAFAATPRSGLEQHRITDAFAGFAEGVEVLRFAVIARHQWHASLFHQRLGGGFAAHRIDGRGGRAEEDQPGGFDGAGESGVFR